MIIPKRLLDATVSGDYKSLGIADSLTRDSADKVLFRITPIQRPGWTVEYRSSHTKEVTIKHLVLKELLTRLNKREVKILQICSIELPDREYFVIRMLLQHLLPLHLKKELLRIIIEEELFSIRNPEREFSSFRPRLSIHKIWTKQVKLPPKRFIGVGYKDQGSLSSVLSWKEQQLPDGEESPSWIILKMSLMRMIKGVPPRLGVTRPGKPPTEESQVGRNEGKKK